MPAYEEKLPKKSTSILFLLIAFFLIYSPFQLDDWQLRRREERYAAIAYEMNLNQPNTIIHGEQIPFHYPLYPLFVALMHKTGASFEFSLRFISILSLFLITVLVYEAGRRAVDVQTAIVGAAMVFSSVIIIEKTLDGYPHLTTLLFLLSAWLSWFTYGVGRGQWNRAWIISFFFGGLGFYTLGMPAVIYCFFPLIFMRRPMTVWPQIKKPGFIVGLCVLVAFFLLWSIPRVYDIPFRDMNIFPLTWKEYARHIFTFPFDLFLRFAPWCIIAWPAFCVAYFPLDTNPIFSRFLRTIVISLFFLLWFSPFTEARDMIFLAPPVSILCGINYWLLMRRHGVQIHFIFKLFSYIAIVIGVGIIIFYTTSFPWSLELSFIPKNLEFRDSYRTLGILQAVLAIGISAFAIFKSKRGLNVISHALMISVSITLCIWAINIPYRTMNRQKIEIGEAFAKVIKEDLGIPINKKFPAGFIVYKGPGILRLTGPCFYMNTKVKKIHDLQELPKDRDSIYMIATKYPISSDYSWKYITKKDIVMKRANPYIYRGTRFYILKGTKVVTNKDSDHNL